MLRVVDFYSHLDEKDIKFVGIVDINVAEIEELSTLSSIGVIKNYK